MVPIAHNSGGPAADIVTLEEVPGGLQATGYLCTSEEEFAAAITDVLAMDQVSRLRLAAAARRYAARPGTLCSKQRVSAALASCAPVKRIIHLAVIAVAVWKQNHDEVVHWSGQCTTHRESAMVTPCAIALYMRACNSADAH